MKSGERHESTEGRRTLVNRGVVCFFFFQAEDGIRDLTVTGVQTCALPISRGLTVFHGQAAGAEGEARGEVVFNTSMTGYQEVLTDPSYAGQIVTMTCPEKIGRASCRERV